MGKAQDDFGPRQICAAAVEEYRVGGYCPTPDGSGLPTAVAIELKFNGLPPLFWKFDSPADLDQFVSLLIRYRREVWPYLR